MSRRALAIIVGVVGSIIAALTLLLMLVMGSVFADARTENIAGPGVDVFLRTPFPGEGGTVVVDVEARGGSKAGVGAVVVTADGSPLATATGNGVTWGYSIREGRDRGHDTVTVQLAVPPSYKADSTLPLVIDVDYVVAMSHGDSFDNEPRHGTVKLDVTVYSPSGRTIAQVSRVLLALGCFLLWFMIVWGVAKLYAKADDGTPIDRKSTELEAIGLLMGFLGGSVLGYWLFAWRMMNALELRSNFWAFLLMVVWCVAPLAWVWRWWKRRRNRTDLPSARVIAR